jgi:hypothetical protein
MLIIVDPESDNIERSRTSTADMECKRFKKTKARVERRNQQNQAHKQSYTAAILNAIIPRNPNTPSVRTFSC